MAQGFTTIIYGNVMLCRVTTRNISQEPVWDESHTNLLYMKTTVAVSGYLNGRVFGKSSGSGVTFQYDYTTDGTAIDPLGFASLREQQIRRQLGPRKPFRMIVGDLKGDGSGGVDLIMCNPATAMTPNYDVYLGDIDLNNGPRCLDFKITCLTGDELYAIDATFEICQLECDQFGNVPDNTFGVLSNRWSCRDSLDANLRTTRTYSGTLVLASQLINAQQLRWIALPPLVPMFRRDHFEFLVTEDGLKLQWTVTDIEVAMSPPFPAKTWSVTHSVGGLEAMKGEISVEVNLTGDVNVNKTDLIELAIYIITAKIYGKIPGDLNGAVLDQYFLKSMEFVDFIGDENRIMARATASATLFGSTFVSIYDQGVRFGQPLNADDLNVSSLANANPPRAPYDRTLSYGAYSNDPTPYSSPAASITQIFMNYCQTPCNDIHATFNGPESPGGGGENVVLEDDNDSIGNFVPSPEDQDPPTFTTTITSSTYDVGDSNPYISISQETSIYVFWQLENLYKTKTMRVQMPIARVPFPGDPGGFGINFLPTSSISQLSGPQTVRIVRVTAERIGAEPQFPDPERWFSAFIASNASLGASNISQAGTTQIFQYPLGLRIKPATTKTTVTGALLYRASAEYYIALSRYPNPGEQLDLGNNMWSNTGNLATDPSGDLTNSDWINPPLE